MCPREALNCHLCNINIFTSVRNYDEHIRSKPHKKRTLLYRDLNDATLKMLKANAKLACDSERLNLEGEPKNMKYCYKCCCHYWVSKADHFKSVNHQLVKSYTLTKCCGKVYHYLDPAGNYQLEEHRFSVYHLKTQYLKKLKKEQGLPESSDDEQSIVSSMSLQEKISQLQFPKFDPTREYAPELLEECSVYRCKACDTLLKDQFEVETHCKSFCHFNLVSVYFTKQNASEECIPMECENIKTPAVNDSKMEETESQKGLNKCGSFSKSGLECIEENITGLEYDNNNDATDFKGEEDIIIEYEKNENTVLEMENITYDETHLEVSSNNNETNAEKNDALVGKIAMGSSCALAVLI